MERNNSFMWRLTKLMPRPLILFNFPTKLTERQWIRLVQAMKGPLQINPVKLRSNESLLNSL